MDGNWNGYLDEVRVASTTRSADWIKTEYNNQSTSTMLSFGTLQASSTITAVPDSGSSAPLSTLTWDYLNRLTQHVSSNTTSTYSYDTSNERVKMVVQTGTSTATTYYPTKFYNITAGIPTKHISANGITIATIIGTGATSTISFILADHLTGSSVVTNASGTIIEVSDYYPYGAVRIDDQTGFNEQRKFAGHEYDGSTGLSYMGARYYNGSNGKFLSQDPAFLAVGDRQKLKNATTLDLAAYLSNPQAANAYAYAYNNPLIYRDESGKFAFLIPLGVMATEAALAAAPTIITWSAAAGIAISAPLVGGATYSYVKGDDRTGNDLTGAAMTTFSGVAGVTGATLYTANTLESYATKAGADRTVAVPVGPQTKIHGNSLSSPKLNRGYQLVDKNSGEVVKYGITGNDNPLKRYTGPQYDRMNAEMKPIAQGSRSEMRSWETQSIQDYEARNGMRPKYNKNYR